MHLTCILFGKREAERRHCFFFGRPSEAQENRTNVLLCKPRAESSVYAAGQEPILAPACVRWSAVASVAADVDGVPARGSSSSFSSVVDWAERRSSPSADAAAAPADARSRTGAATTPATRPSTHPASSACRIETTHAS